MSKETNSRNIVLENFIQCLKKVALHHSLKLLDSDVENESIKSIVNQFCENNDCFVKTNMPYLNELKSLNQPALIRKKDGRFVVVFSIQRNKAVVEDVKGGKIEVNWRKYSKEISVSKKPLLILPIESKKEGNTKFSILYFLNYVKPYKSFLLQIIYGLLLLSILQILPPFITQIIVDSGIRANDIGLINILLFGLVFINIGKAVTNMIRTWIYLHVGSRINIKIVSDFIKKVMSLPISFFTARKTGDIIQRISDHKRIENFLTTSCIDFIFASFNITILGLVMFYYSNKVFLIFLIGSVLYFLWVILFWKFRSKFDLNMFKKNAENQNILIRLFQGAQEIKMYNNENVNRWKWEDNQVDLFEVKKKLTMMEVVQSTGSLLINEFKNVLIMYTSAIGVINGDMTFGMMLSVQYIVGQSSQPINQFAKFIIDGQMALISFNRLNEIHDRGSEYEKENEFIAKIDDPYKNLRFEDVKFKYPGGKENVLNGLDCSINTKKVTAIVGSSGSGKSTVLKLILKFYWANSGRIFLGKLDLRYLSTLNWRDRCGAILQNSVIFDDTILSNIAVASDRLDKKKLIKSVEITGAKELIDSLPKGFSTKLGAEGVSLSEGQKQRILLSRLIYKNPDIVLLDEATNSLDELSESRVLEKMLKYFSGKTVILVTHNRKILKYADEVLHIEKGRIVNTITKSQEARVRKMI